MNELMGDEQLADELPADELLADESWRTWEALSPCGCRFSPDEHKR